MAEDGGYYAIKGFEYQIDKAILEILNTSNENHPINIEQIQDIDASDFVMQVKYKETQKFTPSKIKAPVIQLIDEFNQDNSKKYILYAYFKDLTGYEDFIDTSKKVTLTNLETILGDKKTNYTQKEKKYFIKKFNLNFSPKFQTQFEQVISKLKEESFVGDSDDEAIFFYSNISDYIRKVVVNNPQKNIKNRSCTKKEIFEFLNIRRNLIFNSAFREYKGNEKYFKMIKKTHFTWRNIDNFERFIVVELSGTETVSTVKEISIKIIKKFYKKAGTTTQTVIKSGAPYIYFKNINDIILINLKTEFQSEGIIFKDGYDFYNANFSLTSLKAPSTVSNDICLKFIHSNETLTEILQSDFQKTKEIYQFFTTRPINIEEDIHNIDIHITNISDIKYIV